MARGQRGYERETIMAAIQNSRGIVSNVARRLDCDWATARSYINKWDSTRRAFDAERQCLVDAAENNVAKAVIDENDLSMSKWVLATLGRNRGYDTAAGGSVTVTKDGEGDTITVRLRWDNRVVGDDDQD